MSATFTVNALFAGKPQPLGPRGAPSSIMKSPVDSLTVHMDGTDEDEQANKRLHGGPEKVPSAEGSLVPPTRRICPVSLEHTANKIIA